MCDDDQYTSTHLLCHIGTPILYRQLLPPHFPSHFPHRIGSKGEKLCCMEIQCRILLTRVRQPNPNIQI